MEFFAVEAPAVADCCRRMAERFTAGASLFVMGEGAQASDAQHVAVEFVHPIIVGKRALPAIALTSDIGVFTGAGQPRAARVVRCTASRAWETGRHRAGHLRNWCRTIDSPCACQAHASVGC